MGKEPIDAEKIGAVLDGTAGEERDMLLARLAADEDDYDVFADTAAVLREIEEEEEAESVAPEPAHVARVVAAEAEPTAPVAEISAVPDAHVPATAELPRTLPSPAEAAHTPEPDGVIPLRPRRRSVWTSPAARWLAAAAVLVAVAVPVIRSRASGDAWGDPHQLALAMGRNGLGQGVERAWVTPRGGERSGEPLRGMSAKVGTLHTDLEIAANARGPRDTAAVRDYADMAADAIHAINRTETDPVATPYRLVETSATARQSVLLASLSTARKQAEEFLDGDYFQLGAWTEAARLAASREDAKFFSPRNTRRPLERAEALEGLSAQARSVIPAIRSAVEQEGGIGDWNALSADLKTLHQGLVTAFDSDDADLP